MQRKTFFQKIFKHLELVTSRYLGLWVFFHFSSFVFHIAF